MKNRNLDLALSFRPSAPDDPDVRVPNPVVPAVAERRIDTRRATAHKPVHYRRCPQAARRRAPHPQSVRLIQSIVTSQIRLTPRDKPAPRCHSFTVQANFWEWRMPPACVVQQPSRLLALSPDTNGIPPVCSTGPTRSRLVKPSQTQSNQKTRAVNPYRFTQVSHARASTPQRTRPQTALGIEIPNPKNISPAPYRAISRLKKDNRPAVVNDFPVRPAAPELPPSARPLFDI
jgi:hypothetical protein